MAEKKPIVVILFAGAKEAWWRLSEDERKDYLDKRARKLRNLKRLVPKLPSFAMAVGQTKNGLCLE